MTCKNCGAFCADNSTICENCGSQLENVSAYQSANNSQQMNGGYQEPQPYNNGQQYYQQPSQNQYQTPFTAPQTQAEEHVSVKEWFLSMLILMIPIVGIVMVFVWAFGDSTKKSKSNYFKAYLIWLLILVVLSIIIAILIAALGIGLGSMYYF